MLWLSLNFYQLPLEVFSDSNNQSVSNTPFAILEKDKLAFCNQVAMKRGLSIGMKSSTAYALSKELKVRERNISLEEYWLQQIASIAYQFSSQVCLYGKHSVLLEVEASCKLFTNLRYLLHSLKEELVALPIGYYASLAGSIKASYLLSCYEKNTLEDNLNLVTKLSLEEIRQEAIKKLMKFPLYRLSNDQLCISKIELLKTKKMGLNTIGELFDLPVSAVTKGFGKPFMDYLYCLKGYIKEPQKLFSLPESFFIERCFVDGLDSVEQILFPAKQMLASLVFFLKLRKIISTEITWKFICFNGEKSCHKMHLSNESQSFSQLIMLTRLKLQNVIFEDKVETIILASNSFVDLKEEQSSLDIGDYDFAGSDVLEFKAESISYLLDKLNIRLGSQSCLEVNVNNRYFPEELSLNKSSLNKRPSNGTLSNCMLSKPSFIKNISEKTLEPLWLLKEQKKIINHDKEKLEIISLAEIIESNWWLKEEKRKYYLAHNHRGGLYWIFLDYDLKEWFVHGVF